MIASISETTRILSKYDLFAKKKFGQNFLIDSNIVNKIVNSANIDEKTGVIEIGPGIGGMTEILSKKAGKVLCFEIDSDMVEVLNSELIAENIKIVNEDFLKTDLDSYFSYFEGLEKVVVVSNLPYYITTPIIFKLLGFSNRISKMYFMVQKEVCERLCAKVKTKEYSSLTVLIKLNGEAKQEFVVSRKCFYPSPNVDSAIVSINITKDDSSLKNDPNFIKFIQNIFEMKRKTLVNNLLNKYKINKELICEVLMQLGIKESVRAEELSDIDIKLLYNKLSLYLN